MTSMAPVAPRLTVHLMGGLGNQLFQYAFGRMLAHANGAELLLDASGYETYGPENPERGVRACGLQHFNIAGRIVGGQHAPASPWMDLQRKAGKSGRLLRRLLDLPRPYYLRQEIDEPKGNYFRFDPRVCARTFQGALSVRGFWQTEKYFKRIEPLLRGELRWRTALPRGDAALAGLIEQSISVGIHVRHGDNAGVAAALGVLPTQYYAGAVRQLGQQFPEASFFVFSDDIEWAKVVLPGNLRRTLMPRNRDGRDHEDLRLMSLCKHHVIANSTFSWWGAWLGKKPGQIVYAPRRYYQNIDRPNPDLYPKDWRLI